MGRPKGPTEQTQEFVRTCHAILAQIQPATVRAVCYQCFTRHLIESMGKNDTSRVSRILIRARERGEIPWAWIVAEHEKAHRTSVWDTPEDFLRACRVSYRKDLWSMQPNRVEVWSEKGTVRGTLQPIKENYGITIRYFGGWGGGTDLHDLAEEIASDPRPFHALYVGDLDCSGGYMSDEDLPRRLERYGAGNVHIHRLAVVPWQTEDLLSFPVKSKAEDTRYKWFVKKYGRRCYELDAMDPRLLRRVVEQEIQALIDREAWQRGLRAEEAEAHSIEAYMAGFQRRKK